MPFAAAQETLLEHGVDLTATVMDEREWQHLLGRERRIARDIERGHCVLSPANQVPATMGAILRRLQGYREASDYTRGFVMPQVECQAELAATRQYIDTIRTLLTQGGWLTA